MLGKRHCIRIQLTFWGELTEIHNSEILCLRLFTVQVQVKVRIYFKCGFAVETASSALYINKKTAAATLAGANAAIATEKAPGSRTRRAMSRLARSGPAAGGLVEVGGRRWASLLKAASEQDSACDVVVGQVWSCCWRLGGS